MVKKLPSTKSPTKQKQVLEKQNSFINELIRQNYHICNTCKKTHTGRATYYQWLKDYPKFVAKLEKLRDQEVDNFEDAFRDLIEERNPQAVIFGLKTRGANRGYQEKQQIEHFGAAGIKVVFDEPGERKIKVINEDEVDKKDGDDNNMQ